MASLWQKTLFYLGLVDEEQAEQRDVVPPPADSATVQPAPQPVEPRTVERVPSSRVTVPGRRVEPPVGSRRRISTDPERAEAGVYLRGEDDESRTFAPVAAESQVIVARAFSDAQLLADFIQSRTAVVLDLRTTEPEMVRRLVDFASGLTYALDGSMRKVAKGVILVSPPRVALSTEERRRLSELGLFDSVDA